MGSSAVSGTSSNDQLLRHDEHSIKSVRAKIAMFSTQNSIESPSTASPSTSSNSSASIVRTTPSPVGNSNRNSLSEQHSLRTGTSTATPPPTAPNTIALSALSRSSTHGDVRCDIDLVALEANSAGNNNLPSKGGIITPYHRSMINVSSNISDAGASQQRATVTEKSLSHVDLTKPNELFDHKNHKPHLARVNSSEEAGAQTRHGNKILHHYNQNSPQHGRSQSLMEIGSNMLLGEGATRENQNISGPGIKNCYVTNDNIITKKVISDRSQSSSALLITTSVFDESKAAHMNPNLIESRRRHTLTRLKGNL